MRLSVPAASLVAIAALLPQRPAALHAQGSAALESVAAAMGGKDRVLAVRTVVLTGAGEQFNFGQNLTPDAPLPRYEVTQFKRSFDFANKRWFVDQTREPRFVTGNTAAQRQRFGVDNDLAYNVGNDGAMVRLGDQAGLDRGDELIDHPVGFVQTAYATGSVVTDDNPSTTGQWIRITAGRRRAQMLVDRTTMLPIRIQRIIDNPLLGDITYDVDYADWRDVDGLKLPARTTVKLDGRWTTGDYRATSMTVNADVGDLAATAEARSQTPPAPTVNVVVEEIAPGVWSLAGQSHHTIAIETSRGITLVEAPQSDARTLAAIEKARTLRPGKPVDLVINTHHHFDHSGGVRAAISQGLTIVTHEGNRDFYERMAFPRRHTIAPDALTRNPRPLNLLPVRDRLVRRDSVRTVEVYALEGNEHSGTMLVVYLPAEKLLIQADLYSPPAPNATAVPNFPFVANLLDNIQRRGLQVDRVVGIHGRVAPLSELQAAATRPR